MDAAKLAHMIQTAERYCVILQTLNVPPAAANVPPAVAIEAGWIYQRSGECSAGVHVGKPSSIDAAAPPKTSVVRTAGVIAAVPR